MVAHRLTHTHTVLRADHDEAAAEGLPVSGSEPAPIEPVDMK